jgi:hypothetical protein
VDTTIAKREEILLSSHKKSATHKSKSKSRSKCNSLSSGKKSLPKNTNLTFVQKNCYEIPELLKNLTESFKKIEKSLAFLGICSKPTFFPNIKEYARHYLKFDLEENDLFKILAICPNLYKYSYELNEKTTENEIFLFRNGATANQGLAGATQGTPDEVSSQKNFGCWNLNATQRLQLWTESVYTYLIRRHDEFLIWLVPDVEIPIPSTLKANIAIIDIDCEPLEPTRWDYETSKNWHEDFLASGDLTPDFKQNLPDHKSSRKTTSLKDLKKFLNKKSQSETQSLNIISKVMLKERMSKLEAATPGSGFDTKDPTSMSDFKSH